MTNHAEKYEGLIQSKISQQTPERWTLWTIQQSQIDVRFTEIQQTFYKMNAQIDVRFTKIKQTFQKMNALRRISDLSKPLKDERRGHKNHHMS